MNKENRKNKRKREKVERERGSNERKTTQSLGNHLLDHESSVEVGYGFHAIRSKLLIANDMC